MNTINSNLHEYMGKLLAKLNEVSGDQEVQPDFGIGVDFNTGNVEIGGGLVDQVEDALGAGDEAEPREVESDIQYNIGEQE